MSTPLIEYVKDLNAMQRMFKRPSVTLDSAKERKVIRDNLECELSPENLCCDGELSGAPLRAKAKRLYGAMHELNALEGK